MRGVCIWENSRLQTYDEFCSREWLRRPGGQGGFRPPPMPPWTLYTPFKRPRDTPGPPLHRYGHYLLFLDRQGPYRARHLVWSWASNQSGAASDTHIAWHLNRGTYRNKVVLPWRYLANTPRIDRRRGAGGGISCAEGDSGPPRDGREPRWARPCEASGALFLSNEGVRGRPCSMHLLAAPGTLWVLSRVGKYLVRPQADETCHKKQVSCGRQGKALSCFFLFLRRFRLCGGDQRAFRSPFGNLRAHTC